MSKGANERNYSFYLAALGGHMDVLQFMISKGVNNWDAGLSGACAGGHMAIVQLMVLKGANNWSQGFISACGSGYIDIAQLMISNADVKSTIVYFHTLNQAFLTTLERPPASAEILQFLLLKGADNFCEWPKHYTHVYQLLYLQTPLEKFLNIKGYRELQSIVLNTRQAILGSKTMISDLLVLVSQYIII